MRGGERGQGGYQEKNVSNQMRGGGRGKGHTGRGDGKGRR